MNSRYYIKRQNLDTQLFITEVLIHHCLPFFTDSMEELVKSESASGLTLMEVEKPKLGPRDVLFQVDRTGICGTDLHIYNWDSWT